MNILKRKTFVLLALLGLFLTMLAPSIGAGEEERFLGNVMRVSGFERGMERLTMSVTNWTSKEERDKLIQLLAEKGNDAMVAEMRKMKAGHVWATATLRWPLNVAISEQTEQGRLITLVTERPMSWEERTYDPIQSREHMFGYIEFLLDESGKGQGTLIEAAKIRFKDGQIQIETFWVTPQLLNSIRKTK
jgi:hypothetical protein